MMKKKQVMGKLIIFAVMLMIFAGIMRVQVKAATRSREAKCTVSVSRVNSWKEGSQSFSQFSVKITNKEKKALSTWSVKLDFDRKYKLTDSWCGKYSAGSKRLSIKPESYNKKVPLGGSVEIGFIVKSSGTIKYNTVNLSVKAGGKTYSLKKTRKDYKETTVSKPKATPIPTPKPKVTPTPKPQVTSGTKTPVQKNGKLSVKNGKLVNSKGKSVVLKGVSTHGINWFGQYVNSTAFKTLRDKWGVDCIRLAMYTEEYNGYCSGGSQKDLKKLIDRGVKYATELGMYVIIDWHILSDGSPKKNQSESLAFFKEMARKYKNHDNVIYEICNEPNGGVQWKAIKAYAQTIIKGIRTYDKKNIILVGTPTWSQDVDIVAKSPIKGYSNLMYTFHFYAATHGEDYRKKVQAAIGRGLPVFVSEFGLSEASGNGKIDKTEGNKWINFLKKNKISFVCWSLSNKDESCSLLKSSSKRTGRFVNADLSPAGLWYKSVKK